jgi:hypothetical protein
MAMSDIHKAILDAMADIDAISKDKRNAQQGFQFRGIDDVYNRLHPILAKHRIYSTPEVIEERSEERKTAKGGNLIYRILKVRYTFFTDDGTSVSTTVMGEGMDSGDKASNKAMAVAHKYALLQLFCIPTEDMVDPDAETPPPSKPAPKPKDPQRSRIIGEIGETIKDVPDEEYKDRVREAIRGAKTNKVLGDILEDVKLRARAALGSDAELSDADVPDESSMEPDDEADLTAIADKGWSDKEELF